MHLAIDASNIRAGGGVTHLVELLKAAHPEAHGFSRVVVWAGRATLSEIVPRPWLELRHGLVLDGPLPQRAVWQLVRLPRLVADSCDVLFVPGGTCGASFSPFVAMSRNLLPFDPRERRRYGLTPRWFKFHLLEATQSFAFRRAAGVVFLTQAARQAVLRRTGPLRARAAVIPHGVADRFRRPPPPQRPLSGYSAARPFRWLYVSIVSPYKHQWHVAEGVARLRAQGLPIALDLVGPAEPAALRRLQAVLRRVDPSRECIRYHGAVPYGRLHDRYHNADGFVFASSCENMPNILLEAMAAGLPIACSARDPMPEVLGEAGQYFDPEKPESIARALEALTLSHALRADLAGAAYERAERYSWPRCADETFSFLAEVTRGCRGTASA